MGKKGNGWKMKMPGSERPPVPADPLLAGLLAGPTAALNSVQAQRGIRGNLSTCLDNPPSATLPRAIILDPNAKHMGASECEVQLPLRAQKLQNKSQSRTYV